MALSLVLGKSGAGKSEYLYKQVVEYSMSNPEKSVVVIVPEQFTLHTQQEIINLHPKAGLMNIEVLSFRRLAYRFKEDLISFEKKPLTDVGKYMLIKHLLKEHADHFEFIHHHKNKPGYIEELKGLITEFYQYNIDEDSLGKQSSQLEENKLLKRKLEDLGGLFRLYHEKISSEYINSEDLLKRLSDIIELQPLVKGSVVVLDGFYGFTPVQYMVMEKMALTASDVYVSVTTESSEHLLYQESNHIVSHINKMCDLSHVALGDSIVIDKDTRYTNDAIKHLRDHLYHFPYKAYKKSIEGVYLSEATSIKEEVAYVADSISHLVINKGYRYKDIIVMSGDLASYKYLVEAVFSQYDIPYFIDEKATLANHPVVHFILSALSILDNNYRIEDICHYMKSGFLDIELEQINQLENHALSYGYKGVRRWHSKWESIPRKVGYLGDAYASDYIHEINQTKDLVIGSMELLKGPKKRSASQWVLSIYKWLEVISLEEQLHQMRMTLEDANEQILAQSYAQIFARIIEVLEQITDIYKEDTLTLEQFIELLSSGFEITEIGMIPGVIDQVMIGSLDRSRFSEPKALFVMGINEGQVPKSADKASIITDNERKLLIDNELDMAPDNQRFLYQQQFNIYMAMCRVKEVLYMSYASLSSDGKSIRPSMLVSIIKKILPTLKTTYISDILNRRLIINKKSPSFYRFMDYTLNNQKTVKYYGAAKDWYLGQGDYKSLHDQVIAYSNKRSIDEFLSSDTVKALYGDVLTNSVTRLEGFAKCPFAHFVDYGLRLEERLEFSIKLPDIGVIFHKSIDRFAHKLEKVYHISWESLSDSKRHTIVLESVAEVVEEEQRGLFIDNARSSYLIQKVTRIVDRSIWAITHQINSGEFRPIGHEYRFTGEEEQLNTLKIDFDDQSVMKLRGTVDRVDYYDGGDTGYLTIIDYKSGNQSFDVVGLYYGLQLQLFVYMNAMQEVQSDKQHKKMKPAGAYYFHIDDPLLKADSDMSLESVEAGIKKQLRLQGVTLKDSAIFKALDGEMDTTSTVIPLRLKKDGTPMKNDQLLEEEVFDNLLKYTQKKVKSIGEEIIAGKVTPLPYKKGEKKGCDFCDYASICGFNPDTHEYKTLEVMKSDEVHERISKVLSEKASSKES